MQDSSPSPAQFFFFFFFFFASHLSQGDDALLGSDDAALDHEEVLVDLSVVREAAHRSDGLLRQVVVGRRVVLHHLVVLRVDALRNQVTPCEVCSGNTP